MSSVLCSKQGVRLSTVSLISFNDGYVRSWHSHEVVIWNGFHFPGVPWVSKEFISDIT